MSGTQVSSDAPPPPLALPKPQATWKVVACTIAFPLCFVAIATASAGLWVLTDGEQKSWISQTQFAETWKRLVVWNPMISNLLFNGGMIGAVMSFTVLRKHQQGKLLKNVRVLTSKDIADSRGKADTKKKR